MGLWNAEDDMTNFQRNFNTGEVEIEDSVIYHKTEFKERRNHYAFYSVNQLLMVLIQIENHLLVYTMVLIHPEVVAEGNPKNTNRTWMVSNCFTLY